MSITSNLVLLKNLAGEIAKKREKKRQDEQSLKRSRR